MTSVEGLRTRGRLWSAEEDDDGCSKNFPVQSVFDRCGAALPPDPTWAQAQALLR